MGRDAGGVFVHRDIAKLVVNTDFNLHAALQYAVIVLKIPHIIVFGHYECGKVRANMKSVDNVAPLENRLRNFRDLYRIHQKELNAISDREAAIHRRLVELNVLEQCVNLYKTGVKKQSRVNTFNGGADFSIPRIHPCVFDPATGDLKKLDVSYPFINYNSNVFHGLSLSLPKIMIREIPSHTFPKETDMVFKARRKTIRTYVSKGLIV